MIDKKKYSLWTAPYNPNVLKDVTLRTDLSAGDLERRLKEKQESCEHKMQHFGPSYTARRDGSYRLFNESNCMKCGYNPKEE